MNVGGGGGIMSLAFTNMGMCLGLSLHSTYMDKQ
jgi:hypothetical protein